MRPSKPIEDNNATNEQQIRFTWLEPNPSSEETGNSEILSYNVQWDQGTSGEQWFDLVGFHSNFIQCEYTATALVQAGFVY
jgi:hypothetical protein